MIREKKIVGWTDRQTDSYESDIAYRPIVIARSAIGAQWDAPPIIARPPNKWRTEIGYNLIRRIGYEVAADSVGA